MRAFAYTRPESIDETLALLDAGHRPLAGGTDLITLMKGDIVAPEQLIDIKRLPDLSDDIAMRGDSVSLGALVTLSQIENDPLITAQFPALAQAASLAATPQLRNMATLGGNVLQRPRCWYFRADEVPCWLKGGDTCFAREGENQQHAIFDVSPCMATHPSDLVTVLVAYGASVQYRDDGGVQDIGIEDFLQPPTEERRTENVLPEKAVITGISLPLPGADSRSCYLKAMDRKVWAFALAGVAVVLDLDGETVTKASVVLGGVAPVPIRAKSAEDLLIGSVLDEDVFTRAAEAAVAKAEPLEHNGYKVPLTKALVRNALRQVAG